YSLFSLLMCMLPPTSTLFPYTTLFRSEKHGWISRFGDAHTPPHPLRWNPPPLPEAPADFIDGVHTWAGNGSPDDLSGVAVHLYADRKSTRLNSSHVKISYAVFCLKKKK